MKPEKLAEVDLLVVRELTGGLYFGQPKGRDWHDGHERAVDTLEYFDFEVRRVVDLAFRLALGRRKKVTSVDKANVLESSRLWRQIATAIGAEHEDVILEHMLVDTAAMRLIANPGGFDVVGPCGVAGFRLFDNLTDTFPRPFSPDRDGFLMGEGGALFVLEPEGQARAAGRRIHAFLAGAGAGHDACHPTRPAPDRGN